MTMSSPSRPSESRSPPPCSQPTADQVNHLDDLLAQYLETLDSYQNLRTQLSKSFSDGFLSLAHANRTSLMGSGRRYGEEGFDQRMKARTTVCVGWDRESGRTECRVMTREAKDQIQRNKADDQATEMEKDSLNHKGLLDPAEQTSHLPTPPPDASPPGSDDPKLVQDDAPGHRDPLHWYGILVPPCLRSAQRSFSESVGTQIPELVELQAELSGLEEEIRSARKAAGLPTQAAEDEDCEQGQEECSAHSETSLTSTNWTMGKSVDKGSGKGISGTLSSRSRADPPLSRVLKVEK